MDQCTDFFKNETGCGQIFVCDVFAQPLVRITFVQQFFDRAGGGRNIRAESGHRLRDTKNDLGAMHGADMPFFC